MQANEQEIFRPLIHSPGGSNRPAWAKPNSEEAKKLIKVTHVSVGIQILGHFPLFFFFQAFNQSWIKIGIART